jgi:putative hemolysin
VIEILVITICLALNALLSCLEMAFVTVSRPHLRKIAAKGNFSATRLLKLKEKPERTLSVLQIGITLVGAISAAVGGAGGDEYLSPYLQDKFLLSSETAEAISIAIVVIPLTYLNVVIGELVPKSLALRFPMRLALWGGVFLQTLDRVFLPFVTLLDLSTRSILKLISRKIRPEMHLDESASLDLEPLSDSNKQYVMNLVNVEKKIVSEILVPWDEVTKIDISEHHFSVMQTIKDSRHTRLPIVQMGKVIGFLHAKDFVSEGDVSRVDWTELIRPIPRVSNKTYVLSALKKLQTSNSHMALVLDGETPVGIVTMEDIFEEVVGEIRDEDENSGSLLSRNSTIRTMNFEKP